MSKVIIYTQDGRVSVVHPAPKSQLPNEDENAFLGRVIERSVPPGVPCRIVELADLPPYDSATRNNWRLDGDRVVIRE